ncbi:MAG: hypothetical protein HY901_00580 [Deltaproteobacteria bacterium]|nr:hypothetical protein [Deltaproteobacteria bacterium]
MTGTREKRLSWLTAIMVVSCCAPALAQDRGRTDGPEGSEYGKGGYSRPGADKVSVAVNWGASIAKGSCAPPVLLGATLAYWMDDWFQVELSAGYLFQNRSLDLLVGPRLRTTLQPIGISIGLKGGTILVPYRDDGHARYEPRFAVSPQAGLDLLVSSKLILDLTYAADVDVGERALSHRIFMTTGYRF